MLRLKLRISLTDRWNEDLPNPVGTVLERVGDALYGIGLARVVPTPLDFGVTYAPLRCLRDAKTGVGG